MAIRGMEITGGTVERVQAREFTVWLSPPIIMFAIVTNLPTLKEKERRSRGLGSDGKCLWGTS